MTDVSRWALPASRAVTLVALAGLAVVVALPAHRLPVVAGLVVSVGGAAYGLRFGPDQWKQRLIGLVLFAAGGVALIVADGQAPGWLACGAAIIAGLARLPQRIALFFAIPVAAATCLAPLARGDRDEVLAMAAACGVALVLGLIIGDVRMRAVNAERLLAAEQAAQHSRAQRDRLAERQRIAREIHDILAHTLSAQAVQLEGARLLVEKDGPPDEALRRIRAAQRLAREGLEETRRAVQSLRDELAPIEKTLRRLADDAGAHFRQVGRVWPLEPPAALAVERMVQEGLTNARRHAPGAAVTVDLVYAEKSVTVAVTDTGSGFPRASDTGPGASEPGEAGSGGPRASGAGSDAEEAGEARSGDPRASDTGLDGPAAGEAGPDIPRAREGGPEAGEAGGGSPPASDAGSGASEAGEAGSGGTPAKDTGSGCPQAGDMGSGRPQAPEIAVWGGYGLAGMRERAALIGARLDSGVYGEGFRICLTVPR